MYILALLRAACQQTAAESRKPLLDSNKNMPPNAVPEVASVRALIGGVIGLEIYHSNCLQHGCCLEIIMAIVIGKRKKRQKRLVLTRRNEFLPVRRRSNLYGPIIGFTPWCLGAQAYSRRFFCRRASRNLFGHIQNDARQLLGPARCVHLLPTCQRREDLR
jgi:hypothetical protein